MATKTKKTTAKAAPAPVVKDTEVEKAVLDTEETKLATAAEAAEVKVENTATEPETADAAVDVTKEPKAEIRSSIGDDVATSPNVPEDVKPEETRTPEQKQFIAMIENYADQCSKPMNPVDAQERIIRRNMLFQIYRYLLMAGDDVMLNDLIAGLRSNRITGFSDHELYRDPEGVDVEFRARFSAFFTIFTTMLRCIQFNEQMPFPPAAYQRIKNEKLIQAIAILRDRYSI